MYWVNVWWFWKIQFFFQIFDFELVLQSYKRSSISHFCHFSISIFWLDFYFYFLIGPLFLFSNGTFISIFEFDNSFQFFNAFFFPIFQLDFHLIFYFSFQVIYVLLVSILLVPIFYTVGFNSFLFHTYVSDFFQYF